MDKKICPDGQKWDNLISYCLPITPLQPSPPTVKTEPVSAIDQAETLMLGLSPAVFAVVVLVTVGSILALAVWLIIYRRRTRLGSALVDPEPVEEPLQKMETPAASVPPSSERNGHAGMFQLAADAPSSCPHLYLGTHMGSNWEKGFTTCRGPAMQTNGCTGLPACSIVSEHRVPLPATELGGTALVTTKTV